MDDVNKENRWYYTEYDLKFHFDKTYSSQTYSRIMERDGGSITWVVKSLDGETWPFLGASCTDSSRRGE